MPLIKFLNLRESHPVQSVKNKGNVQSWSHYRGIELMRNTIKPWERVIEPSLNRGVAISEQKYGFMPRKSTTGVMLAFRVFMEKY